MRSRLATSTSILLVCALPVVLVGCRSKAAGPAAGAGMQALPVAVAPVSTAPVADASEFVGNIRSRGETYVRPEVEGQLDRIHVHSGDRVRAGQSLMQIEPSHQVATYRGSQADVVAQRARVAQAARDLKRDQDLYNAKVMARQVVEDAQAAYDTAQAQLRALEAQAQAQQVQLGYYEVRAPRDGVVGDIPVHVGDHVTTSTMLTSVLGAGGLEAYIEVPIEQAPRLRTGLPVVIESGNQTPVHSTVSFVAPQADPTSQSVLVKAEIPAGSGLRADQFIRAQIVWGTHSAVLVPVLDVSRISGRMFVFQPQPAGKMMVATQHPIEISGMQGNAYVVSSGLNPGDKIIVSGLEMLQNGMPVLPMPAPPAAGGAH